MLDTSRAWLMHRRNLGGGCVRSRQESGGGLVRIGDCMRYRENKAEMYGGDRLWEASEGIGRVESRSNREDGLEETVSGYVHTTGEHTPKENFRPDCMQKPRRKL